MTVSSGIHIIGKINFDDLQGERSYSKWGAYGQSKLANLLFAYELQRKLAAAGSGAISVVAHPGYASTNLQSVGPEMAGSRIGKRTMSAANRVLAQSGGDGCAARSVCGHFTGTCAAATTSAPKGSWDSGVSRRK